MFLPNSAHTIFGVDNFEQQREYHLQTNFHARLIYTLDKDLIFQPTLDNYLSEYLSKTHTMGANLQELDLRLQDLNGQIEKERTRKKTVDHQRQERSIDMPEEGQKDREGEEKDPKAALEEQKLKFQSERENVVALLI